MEELNEEKEEIEINGKKALIEIIEISKSIYKRSQEIEDYFGIDEVKLLPNFDEDRIIKKLLLKDKYYDEMNKEINGEVCYDYIYDSLYDYYNDEIRLDELLEILLSKSK